MRKIIITILAGILLLSLPLCANAAEAYIYEDTANDTRLSLPDNWDLEFEEDPLIRVTFLPWDNASARMQYGSSDVYGSLDPSVRAKAKRASYDNSHYSASDIAELVGCTPKEVKRITLSGTEYYRANFVKTVSSGKFSVPLEFTYWIRYDNGWMYVYQYVGSESNELYGTFKNMIANAVYSAVKEEPAADTQKETYETAVTAYEGADYDQAEELFTSVAAYEDSSKYLRLIRIRNAGGNEGMGSKVYKKELGLTEADKKDIDDAASDFAFADTAQVLLCNSDVASYYLTGLWSGGSRSYLHFKTDDTGGSYSIGSQLSAMKHINYAIVNGEFLVDDTDTPILKMTLTAPDTMDVITYEKGNQNYTLTRENSEK